MTDPQPKTSLGTEKLFSKTQKQQFVYSLHLLLVMKIQSLLYTYAVPIMCQSNYYGVNKDEQGVPCHACLGMLPKISFVQISAWTLEF